MKKILLVLALVAGLAGALLTQTGCRTIQPQPGPDGSNTNAVVVFDVDVAVATISGIAELSVYTVTHQNTNTIPYFRLAVETIQGLADSNNFDPVVVETSLAQISQMDDPYVMLGVRAALVFYKSAFSSVVSSQLDQTKYVKPILLALASGIRSGLNTYGIENKYGMAYTKPLPKQ